MDKIERKVEGPFLRFLPFNGGERKEAVCIDELVFGGLSEILNKLTDEELKAIAFNLLPKLTKDHFTISSARSRLGSGGDLLVKPNIFWLKSQTNLQSTYVSPQREVVPESQHYRPES